MRPTDIYDVACPCLDIYKDLLCFFQNTTSDILWNMNTFLCAKTRLPTPFLPIFNLYIYTQLST